jgi:transposase-like protein
MSSSKSLPKYTREKRIEVLAALERHGGVIAKAALETGVGKDTVRRWRDDARTENARRDLRRFTKDAWEIIHRANEIVREKVEELGAKDAASIASGYFDRQARAEEQMNSSGDENEEYVAQWDEGKDAPETTGSQEK